MSCSLCPSFLGTLDSPRMCEIIDWPPHTGKQVSRDSTCPGDLAGKGEESPGPDLASHSPQPCHRTVVALTAICPHFPALPTPAQESRGWFLEASAPASWPCGRQGWEGQQQLRGRTGAQGWFPASSWERLQGAGDLPGN